MESDAQTVEEIELEILAILDDCRKKGMSKEEIREVFSPLGLSSDTASSTLNEDKEMTQTEDKSSSSKSKDSCSSAATLSSKRKNKKAKRSSVSPSNNNAATNNGSSQCSSEGRKRSWKRAILFISIIAIIGAIAFTYCENQIIQLRFHALAIARIFLKNIQPYWDWTDMYYSRCIVKNPFFEQPNFNPDDCNLCETLDEIERVANISQAVVIEQYIKREKPLIVTDAMDGWNVMQTDQFWFDNITELYLHNNHYKVCNLQTNLRVSYGDIGKVMRKLYNPHTTEWFLHWENCQKESAKAIRQFYKRPYFISNSLDFTGSNWVLMSSDFRGKVYKEIEASESLLMVYQVRGFNHIRITPRETCRSYCSELTETLNEGEILVATNLLWVFEYVPGEDGDNLAIISEVSWPSLE